MTVAPRPRLKTFGTWLCILLGLALIAVPRAEAQDESGWISLFNGKDLNGWTPKIRGYPAGENFGETFRVADGVLKVNYDQYGDKFDNRFGHLFTRHKYSDYRLRLEYRFVGEQCPGGPSWAIRNSGVMIHGQTPESMRQDQDFPVSIEVQLLGGDGKNERHTGNVCTPGTNIVMGGKLITRHCTDSDSRTYSGDRWVKLEIEVHGNGTIRHKINGQTVIEYEKPQLDKSDRDAKPLIHDGELMLSEGTISLQSESHPVEFRSIEILPLGPDASESKSSSGIISAYVDPKVRAQDDFFRHINGKWLATAEIPPDRSSDGAFYQLTEDSQKALRAIIEEQAANKANEPGTVAQKVGDLYASFMDEDRAERLGLEPIKKELEQVDAIKDKASLIRTIAEFQRAGIGGLFAAPIGPDEQQSDRNILYLYQGGIGLPDESYYREEKSKDIREAYVKHIRTMFELARLPDPGPSADAIMELETRLAKSHWDRVRSRDATKTYNKKDLKELADLTPGLNWPAYFEALGAPEIAKVVVGQPDFFTAAAKALDEVPIERWKTWLTWRVLRSRASLLNKALVDESFDFYGRTLTGAKEIRPRWKRGVSAVEGALGEAVGKLYVDLHFPPEAKQRMSALVKNLIEAYRQDIGDLDWMSAETKAKALAKLDRFTPKIGYPDKWRDYSKLEIKRDDLIGNVRRAAAFEHDRDLDKLNKPVDRSEWFMTPQTVNAYYNPTMNEIVFPAAILQPPFFDMKADDAVNYGGIGAVIGHEIGHGFDDQGSKYDGNGNMQNWWTDADRKEFDKRAQKLIEQYNAYEPAALPGQHVNGALTIGENIGDLGGLTIAYKAYKLSLGGHEPPKLDGLTGDQRFFIGWAQVWRAKYRDAEARRRLAIDPHSPAEFRCNGVVRNLPQFYEAFQVKEGDKLYLPPDQRVRIW